MPIYHAKEILKSIHTETLFFDCFFKSLSSYFWTEKHFLKKTFWLKSLQIVSSLTGLKKEIWKGKFEKGNLKKENLKKEN